MIKSLGQKMKRKTSILVMEDHFSKQPVNTEIKHIFVFRTGNDRRIDVLGMACTKEGGSDWWYGCIACEIGVRIGAPDHDNPNNPIECVMSYYSDSLDWCEECQNIIWGNKFRFGFIIKQYNGAIPFQMR